MKTTAVNNGRYQTDSMTQRKTGGRPDAAPQIPEPQHEDSGEWKEVDENEAAPNSGKSKLRRLSGDHDAKIVRIRAKESRIGATVVTRYLFEIELDKRRPDLTPYVGYYNCIASWKAGSEYQQLAAAVLGRALSVEEQRDGVKPADLKNKTFTVTVSEHRKKDSDEFGSDSTIKIRAMKPLQK